MFTNIGDKCVIIANQIEGRRNLVDNRVNVYSVKDNLLLVYTDLIRSLAVDKACASDITRQAIVTASRFSQKRFLPAYLSLLEEAAKIS